jgi:hypothetical protein
MAHRVYPAGMSETISNHKPTHGQTTLAKQQNNMASLTRTHCRQRDYAPNAAVFGLSSPGSNANTTV